MAKFLRGTGWTGEFGSTAGKSYGSEAEAEAAEAKVKKPSGYAIGGDTTDYGDTKYTGGQGQSSVVSPPIAYPEGFLTLASAASASASDP